jgi:phage antirepressor YoqD-like protein
VWLVQIGLDELIHFLVESEPLIEEHDERHASRVTRHAERGRADVRDRGAWHDGPRVRPGR